MGHKDGTQCLWSRKEQSFSISVMDFRASTSAYVFLYLVQILTDDTTPGFHVSADSTSRVWILGHIFCLVKTFFSLTVLLKL